MEVILLEKIGKLGDIGDTVDPGLANHNDDGETENNVTGYRVKNHDCNKETHQKQLGRALQR